MASRPDLPAAWIQRVDAALAGCPECQREPAWTGVRWRVGGSNVVGLVLDDDTSWDEVAELVVESYCVQAPPRLVAQVDRPDGRVAGCGG
ncbi:MAG: hypothetical protein WBQ48_01555, partial [Aeromicrobium sp.]